MSLSEFEFDQTPGNRVRRTAKPTHKLTNAEAWIGTAIVCLIFLSAIAYVVYRAIDRSHAMDERRAAAVDKARKDAPTVSVKRILSEYDQNEVNADRIFKNAYFYVEGTVQSVGKDILGSPFVSLSKDRDDFSSVECMFDESLIEQLSNLHKGDTVKFFGQCQGKMLTIVLMRDCELVR